MGDILLFWASKNIDGFRCDMAEMVPVEFWEWCLDWYGTSTDKRVLRGGAFDSPATDC
ncbi:hypothetical protein [Bacteroides sp. 224]|uniref:hypothetical protein n=1 Tax=Bacteroides sp. 224 TaxID=2302936 RepID=UPI0013D19411|nr:hypothetical protein [Bacteroides sp. 224]